MGIELGTIIAIVVALGGFIVWCLNEFRKSQAKKKELEDRFQKIETFIALDNVKEANQTSSFNELESRVKELNKHIDNLDERLRIAEIDIAVLKPR